MLFPKNARQSSNFLDLTSPYLGDDHNLNTAQILEKYNITDKDLDFMNKKGWGLPDMILLKNNFEHIMRQPLSITKRR